MHHSENPLQANEPAINPALERFISRACERGWVDLGEILNFAADMREVAAQDAANDAEVAPPPAPAPAPTLHHSDLAFRSRVADLLHLLPVDLTFMPGDRAAGEKAIADIRAKLAAPPAEASEDVVNKQRRIIERQADQITALKIDLLYAERPHADDAGVVAAARNLVKSKGRFHTEQNYKALADALAQHDAAARKEGAHGA